MEDRPAEPVTLAELVARARALAQQGGRQVLGVTGSPGAGKSTVARQLVTALGPDVAALVPMDGFHYANTVLHSLGRRDRKGAWDTFDADGYVDLLRRLRSRATSVVYAPDFDRDVDEPIGSALPVAREVPLVVTEGNYLLSDLGSWSAVLPLLDESWFLEIDPATRIHRLVARHEGFGMSHEQAVAWAGGTDQTNAEIVQRCRDRATAVLRVLPA